MVSKQRSLEGRERKEQRQRKMKRTFFTRWRERRESVREMERKDRGSQS